MNFRTKKINSSTLTLFSGFFIFATITSLIAPTAFVFAQAMSSSSYGIENDSLNAGGGLSSSNSYGLESSTGETGTGDSSSSNYQNQAGYQQASSSPSTGGGGDTTAPSVPTSLSATAISSSRIDLSWSASTDNVSVMAYKIYRGGVHIATTTSTSYSNTGLNPQTLYSYTVSAVDTSYNESAQSSSASATTLPSRSSGGSTIGTYSLMNLASEGVLNVSDLLVIGGERDITLSWRNPPYNFDSIVIVRSTSFFPSGPTDGTVVFSAMSDYFVDTHVVPGVRYYYAVFTKVDSYYSSGSLGSASLSRAGLGTESLPNDLFAGVVELPRSSVDPMFENFSLADLDLVQNGKNLEFVSNKVNVDGEKNLKFSIPYGKLPEVLKTIAVTMYDPIDPSKTFSFLLRINEDKTLYEAVIGPLGKGGEYTFGVAILDHKNQGLKKLFGTISAFYGAHGLFGILSGHMTYVFYSISALIILLAALLVRFVFFRKTV